MSVTENVVPLAVRLVKFIVYALMILGVIMGFCMFYIIQSSDPSECANVGKHGVAQMCGFEIGIAIFSIVILFVFSIPLISILAMIKYRNRRLTLTVLTLFSLCMLGIVGAITYNLIFEYLPISSVLFGVAFIVVSSLIMLNKSFVSYVLGHGS